jgi:hypothetical protein
MNVDLAMSYSEFCERHLSMCHGIWTDLSILLVYFAEEIIYEVSFL